MARAIWVENEAPSEPLRKARACARNQNTPESRAPAAAEKILRRGLTRGAEPLAEAARASLLNNLALCAMHDGRPLAPGGKKTVLTIAPLKGRPRCDVCPRAATRESELVGFWGCDDSRDGPLNSWEASV